LAAASPAIAVAFPARGLTLHNGKARNRAVNTAFYFTGWRCRLITANTGLSTIFSPGDTLRRDNLMKRQLFPPDTVLFGREPPARNYPVQPLPIILRPPRAMPTGGLLRPEFGNKPSTASP
jgi:hypothetical protein